MITPATRAALVDVLMHHWATRTSGCSCGGVPLGGSWPEHIAGLVAEERATGRFMLFSWDDWDAGGGSGDMVGRFPSVDEARGAATAGNWEVLDLETGEWTGSGSGGGPFVGVDRGS